MGMYELADDYDTRGNNLPNTTRKNQGVSSVSSAGLSTANTPPPFPPASPPTHNGPSPSKPPKKTGSRSRWRPVGPSTTASKPSPKPSTHPSPMSTAKKTTEEHGKSLASDTENEFVRANRYPAFREGTLLYVKKLFAKGL